MMKFSILAIICLALFTVRCNQQEPVTDTAGATEDVESALRKADMEWSKKASDIDGHMQYFTDDAIVLAPNEAMLTGKTAIRQMLEGMHAMPDFSVQWKPTKVKVASSGDLGYTIGTYSLSMTDSTGAPVKDTGKYLTTWEKQPDGSWKVTADMFNSDSPTH